MKTSGNSLGIWIIATMLVIGSVSVPRHLSTRKPARGTTARNGTRTNQRQIIGEPAGPPDPDIDDKVINQTTPYPETDVPVIPGTIPGGEYTPWPTEETTPTFFPTDPTIPDPTIPDPTIPDPTFPPTDPPPVPSPLPPTPPPTTTTTTTLPPCVPRPETKRTVIYVPQPVIKYGLFPRPPPVRPPPPVIVVNSQVSPPVLCPESDPPPANSAQVLTRREPPISKPTNAKKPQVIVINNPKAVQSPSGGRIPIMKHSG